MVPVFHFSEYMQIKSKTFYTLKFVYFIHSGIFSMLLVQKKGKQTQKMESERWIEAEKHLNYPRKDKIRKSSSEAFNSKEFTQRCLRVLL